MKHIDDTFNGLQSRALCSIESEIPSPETGVAVIDAKIAIPENP